MATTGLPKWPWTGAEADALPPAERLLIDCARAWAQAARFGQPALLALRRLLATEDAMAAAEPLDALLRALSQHPLMLGCPLCPRLVGEEPALLLAVACAQRGPRREALACLLRHLPPHQAYAATGAAIALGCAFRRSGLKLGDPWGG
ncbi:hypothetical protein [Falsiroseomonas tokyonensis]|uniref:DUF2753 family protein n=1 Tax=Falsiroseomonas tokyonensis TaxID=430521 RepID=A0ABV7C5D9_9PROT|nr:hypothetical protein [Falsiroseomonas tokyonensis]MBU8541518.1 hypothetical protein [Falsiroseomonas tokyonensis]